MKSQESNCLERNARWLDLLVLDRGVQLGSDNALNAKPRFKYEWIVARAYAETGLANRAPRIHWGARQVPRDPAHHLQRRAGPRHGVRPDGPETDLLRPRPAPSEFLIHRLIAAAGLEPSWIVARLLRVNGIAACF